MRRLKAFIESARPRTLPLSLAGVLLGCLLAAGDGRFDGATAGWLAATVVALQVLANLANEIGDMKHGTDNERRLGPARGLQRGELSARDVAVAAGCAAVVACVTGCLAARAAFGGWRDARAVVLLCSGAAALVAAVRYTVGRRAYGYRGLGDLFVMIFFGWASVAGSYFAMTGTARWLCLLPATAIGAFSVMVLNLNNMRDIENDAACGKRTIPVMLGARRARAYHVALGVAGFSSLVLFNVLQPAGWRGYLFLLLLPFFLYHARAVYRLDGRALDGQLRGVSLATLLVALLAGARGFPW